MSVQKILPLFALSLLLLLLSLRNSSSLEQGGRLKAKVDSDLLKLLDIAPSPESIDYVQDKTQFQLHTLLTEQRHIKTWNLSDETQKNCAKGLSMLFSVDEDIEEKLEDLLRNKDLLEQAVQAIEEAILSHDKIYIYGCGATGRLAKQMESTFWRPFWRKIKGMTKIWLKLKSTLDEDIEDQLIGEMTGGDRALISSLEGFEDLQLIGRLQLKDRKIKQGDVVICVTEGGETSSVIGTILAALNQWKEANAYHPERTRKKLYFIYNNPDEKLLPFDRSREVLKESGITKINLTTGPQAITGSTRMQATTIETFVIGNILQQAIYRTLRRFLSGKDMEKTGFQDEARLERKLVDFAMLLKQVKDNIPSIAKFTRLEAQTYASGHFSTYFAERGLITVFIDSTERSPTFRLFPLDTVKEPKRTSWIQVWTPAANLRDAWLGFLGRPFRGLSPEFYRTPFEEKINDPYLRRAALESLTKAGDDQQDFYDFSFAEFNLKKRGPEAGDLGVAVLISPEEKELKEKTSEFRRFVDLFSTKGGNVALVLITDKLPKDITRLARKIPGVDFEENDALVAVQVSRQNDPLGLNQEVALKFLLNAHSTAVMARLGKVIGNTMTNVSPSNLKLIGRATYLIQSHVNDFLRRPQWLDKYSSQKSISYQEANAVLFDAIQFLKDKRTEAGQTAEVALSIIRILESLRLSRGVSNQEALSIVKDRGLSRYLSTLISGED